MDTPQDVSFFGHFGSANTGNESTLVAVLSALRSRFPKSEFRCICTIPESVVARYGLEASPISARAARLWDRDVPLAKRVPLAPLGLAAEIGQYARAFRKLKGTDMLIVPGTGLVTDAYGLSNWGPYNMFKWVLMAKLRRSRVLVVSVGAGPIDSAAGKVLVKAALSLADYRSYRDEASKDYLAGIGFRSERDPVYPDLVFGLPEASLPAEHDRPEGARRVVGLGLMVYPGKYSASEPRLDTYRAYLESLVVFAAWLLEQDYDIRLLLGDDDGMAIEEFRSLLQTRLGRYDESRIVERPITSVEDVLGEVAATDAVVATRFHNVLLSLLLNKPTVAISFHPKCSALMAEMKLSDYCHEIHQMDTQGLIRQFRQLEQNRDAVKRTIVRGVEHARTALEEQYDVLFPNPDRASAGKAPPRRTVSRRLAASVPGGDDQI